MADHPLGPWHEQHTDTRLIATVPGRVLGPGHASVVQGPVGDVLVYHAWDPQQQARRMCIDPLRWGCDGPSVDGPTWAPVTLGRTPGSKRGWRI